jgi:hypothetical protein
LKGVIKLVIRNSDFHDKIHEFKDVLSSTKVKHENWKNKKDTIISLLASKLDNINKVKVEYISLYKEPDKIGEVEVNKDIHTSFNNMKHIF